MMSEKRLLVEQDCEAVTVVNRDAAGSVLLVCEHASNRLPLSLGTLGLPQEALMAHIAWDPGALPVAVRMAENLNATLVHQNFSRLAYDCNRPPEAADSVPAKSEVFEIPGNAGLTEAQRQQRVAEIYAPFKETLDAVIRQRKAEGRQTLLVTIHSFTPVYNGVPRSVEIGILNDVDCRLADGMLATGKAGSFDIRRNEPYGPEDGVTHTLKVHGLANGLPNVMIEIRNDLIADAASQIRIADYLTGVLAQSLAEIGVDG